MEDMVRLAIDLSFPLASTRLSKVNCHRTNDCSASGWAEVGMLRFSFRDGPNSESRLLELTMGGCANVSTDWNIRVHHHTVYLDVPFQKTQLRALQ